MNNASELLAFAAAMDAIAGYPYSTPIRARKKAIKIYGKPCPVCNDKRKTLYWNGADYVCNKCAVEVIQSEEGI